MTKTEIEGVRVEFKRLMESMVDMGRSQGAPITEIMLVSRDAPRTIDELCNLALKGLEIRPEAAPLRVVREMIRGNPIEHAIVDVSEPDVGLGAWLDRHLPQKD